MGAVKFVMKVLKQVGLDDRVTHILLKEKL